MTLQRLTPELDSEVLRLHESGASFNRLALQFKVTPQAIMRACRRAIAREFDDYWKSLDGPICSKRPTYLELLYQNRALKRTIKTLLSVVESRVY